MDNHIYVIGSGPSGVAAAHTLLKAGRKVTLIDTGFTMEKEYRDLVDNYHKDQNKDEFLKTIKHHRKKYGKQSDVQPAKTLFGSGYPYKIVDDTLIEEDDKAVIRSSLAKGGFSTVWGSNVGCVVPKDITDWPVSFNELKPYYSSLEEIMDVSSPKDEISEVYPVHIGQAPTYPLGRQGNDLYESLKSRRKELADDGVYIGRSKLAIGPKYSLDGKGCTPCGLCMHGCPNNAIFNTAFVIDNMLKDANFTYLPDTLAISFSEGEGAITLHIKDIHTKAESTITCNRLFLACGVFNTTSLVARSMNMTDHEFTIKNSQKYIFPLVRWHRSKGCINENENTADQIFMEVDNPSLSNRVVHMQYYGYNDLILEPIARKIGSIAEYIPKLFPAVLERLMICFVYFHSDYSGTISLKVNELDSGNKQMGSTRGNISRKSKSIMKSILKILKKHRRALGGLPIEFLLQTLLPGDSQHSGSSLPMSKAPTAYETDTLGRPAGCKRVHIVDSTVLPSIPATSLTPTVMVNAMRIADLAIKDIIEDQND